MICKLSPFSFDFGDINNCFCSKELNIFQEVFQYIFLREVQCWRGRNMGEGKPELLWSEMYHSTLASGFCGRISSDFKGKDIVSKRTGRAEVQCSIPAFLTFLFIIFITSGSFSFIHCYLKKSLFPEPENGS